MKQNPSREQLTKSLDRRIKHLMIRVLERFEESFPDMDSQRSGQVFKSDIRTIFNDVIRAQRDELRDYDVDYRPLKMTDDSVLAMTQTFMETVRRIEFDDKPSIRFYAESARRRVLDALRNELGAGVIINIDDGLVLEIVGTTSCVNCVLPIMDRYRLHGGVSPNYSEWRSKVVTLYRS